jgi:hypothetical protein
LQSLEEAILEFLICQIKKSNNKDTSHRGIQ